MWYIYLRLVKDSGTVGKYTIHLVWLMVSTHLKNISQMGNLPQTMVKITNIWNHHLVVFGIGNTPTGKHHDTVAFFEASALLEANLHWNHQLQQSKWQHCLMWGTMGGTASEWLNWMANYSWWFQLVKLDHFPRVGGENKTCLQPPPSL